MKKIFLVMVTLLIGCATAEVRPPSQGATISGQSKEARRTTTEEPEKTIHEYLEEQKASPVLDPEQTISEEALRYFRQANQAEDDQAAIDLLKRAIEADPYYHAAYYLLGIVYWRTNQLAFAEKELEAACSIKPRFSKTHKMLGWLYQELGDFPKAIRKFETVLELHPQDTEARVSLLISKGKDYRNKRDYERAIEYFRQANELAETGSGAALFGIALIHSELQEFENALETLRRLRYGMLGHEKDLAKGFRLYKRMYEANKKDPVFLQSYAYLYYLRHDPKSAIKYFLDAIKIDESKFRCHYALGHSFFVCHEGAKAIEYLERAISKQPDNYDVLGWLGMLYEADGDSDKVIRVYQKRIQIRPGHTTDYYKLATAFHSKGNYEKAREYAMKAIALKEDHVDALLIVGNTYKEERNFAEALRSYRRALELYSKKKEGNDQDIGRIQATMGELYEELDMLDDSLESYSEAYEKLGYSYIEDKIAGIYLKQEKYSKATAMYQKRAKEAPRNSRTHFNLAYAYFKNGKTREAIKEFEKALDLEPGNYRAHYNLGVAYMKLGSETDVERSLIHFKKYIELTKNVEDERRSRKHAISRIAAREFPLKLRKLKGQRGNVGALASLLLMRFDYNRGNNQFLKGIKETRYENYRNIVNPEVFVAESTFEALENDIKAIKTTDSSIQEVIDRLEKAVMLCIEGIRIHNQGYYVSKKDYKGEFERGFAKIKIADGYFGGVLKGLQYLMKKYESYFSEYEVELLSLDIDYYSSKYKNRKMNQ